MAFRKTPGGSGSGAFGAILEQGGGTLAARDAQPTRTDPTLPERPARASDTWDRSLGGNLPSGPRLILTTSEGPGIVIQFDNDASVEGYQIRATGGFGRSYNGGLRVVTLGNGYTLSQTITYINGLQGFPGTASLAPGALGGQNLEDQSHTVGGLVLTYYSQLFVLTNLEQGDESNFSIVTATVDADNPAGSATWDAADRVVTLYFPAGATTRLADFQFTAALMAAGAPSYGFVSGDRDNGDDSIPNPVGTIIPPGQRVDFTGGRDATDVDADPLRGLFVYDDDTDPSWELRGVERAREEVAVRSGFTVPGAGGASLRVLLGDTTDEQNNLDLDGNDYLPETVNEGRVVSTQAADNWTPRRASLSYNDVVVFRAAAEGADGNDLTVRMLEGSPAVEAVTALGAVASLVDGGTRLVEVDWPEARGADANGVRVQVGAPRNIAGVRATAAIYGATFNDRIGTATWYLPGSAINGIRVGIIGTGLSTQADNTAVGSAAGTLDNVLFINVRVAGTVSYQDIIDAFNAIRVGGVQILTAALDNGVDGTTTFDPDQNLGADFAGGVDGTADEVSGTAYWSRATELLYLASDGTVTSAQAVAAINATRDGATASVDTEATNNNIRFTAVQAGEAGNGIQIVISRGAGYSVSVAGRVITVTYPNVASSSGTLIDTINGNTDAAALIRASAIDSTVNFNSNRYVGTFTTAGGADGFDGMAALVAPGVSGTAVPNQTVTAAGGVTGAPAQARTPLAVRERTVGGEQQLLITGIVPDVDTVGIVRAAYTDTTKAFEIIALGANQDYVLTTASGANTLLLNTNLLGGRDMGTRPDLAFTVLFAGGQVRVNLLNLIGSDYDESLQTTLAQIRAELETLVNIRGQIDFVETGDQSSPIAAPYPSGLTGGANYVPPTPIEFLKRGEDEADGKNIEVRYHAGVDTLENLIDAALDSGRNPDGVKVITIAGTEPEAPPEPPPFTKPMVPGAGEGSASTIPVNGLTQAQVDARVRALVRDPALGSSNATWPDDKIPSDVTRDSELDADIAEVRDEIPEVIDTLTLSVTGSMLTITAGQTGTASDIVGTVDISSLEDFLGEWADIPRGASVEEGKTTTHGGRLYWVKVTHNRGNTGPDGDVTNYEVLGNNGGTYDPDVWYPAGTMVNYASAAWWTFVPVSPSDPNPDDAANTKWIRLSDNVDAFTGVTKDGAAFTFTRESLTNPVTVVEEANGFGLARIGDLFRYAAGSTNFVDTGIPLPTNPDDGEVFQFIIRFRGQSAFGSITGAQIKALTTVAVGASLNNEFPLASEGYNVNQLHAARLANGNLATNSGGAMQAGDFIVGYEVGTTQAPSDEEDAPPLPVSRAEAIGIQNNENVAQQAWQQLNPFDAAARVLFGEGDPIIITGRTASTVTIARGVYTVRCLGNIRVANNVFRASPLFSLRTGTGEDTEIARTDQGYVRVGANNRDFPFSLATQLILDEDTELYIYAGSAPDQTGTSGGTLTGGAYQLRSADFQIIFMPTGGSETIFNPRRLAEATFDLTGAAQNVALVDGDSNPIIAPDTGYLIATYDVPTLGLRGSSQLIRADRLRRARESSDLTSGLYTDPDTHQIFYEVAAHAGGATSGNRILIEHIQTAVPTTPSQPVVDPAITEFETTSGSLSPPAGSIANDVYGYTLEVSQPSHVASARIIGFAGAGGADRPASFALLRTVTDFHDESGTVTIPAGISLVADGIYTLRLEVYKTGQTPGVDEPIAYHDVRIVAHAPATAFYHWGRFPYDAADSGAADSVARITDFTGDLETGNRLAASYAATPGATGAWQFYFYAKADETLPAGWQSGGLIADAAFYPPVDATQDGVDYRAWIMRPNYRRTAADGSINYEPRTS